MNSFHFTIPGACRTKKTSNRIVQIKGKNGGRGFTKILPSEAHEAWYAAAMLWAPQICRELEAGGLRLPITAPVEVEAIFYRDRESGDLLGYEQALADWMQADRWTKPQPGKRTKLIRKGAGIIDDDKMIVSWDGSRLAKDAARPRIEVTVYVLEPEQVALELAEVMNK